MASIMFKILLMIDGAIYNLIDYVYDIFDALARINVFSQSDYNLIVSRIYIILGVFMLFILSYSLLRAIISPEDFAKGETSFPNLIKNVVVSLVIIVLLPTVFTLAFNIQNALLNNDTIPKLILGDSFSGDYEADAGRRMAFYTFSAFFHVDAVYCTDGESEILTSEEEAACKQIVETDNVTWWWPPSWFSDEYDLATVDEYVLNGGSFTNYSQFGGAVAENEISYTPILSTVAGIFMLYVLLNFCFDLAVRVVKLAFYQIIAPIPVICRILPGGNMKDVFHKWVKQVISVFLEVIIRVGIMYLGVFIITLIIERFPSLSYLDYLGFSQKMIIYALLIMGVIIFIRQAPKLLGDLLNLDTGGMKLGLMDKLAMGGGLIAGAAAGGALTTGLRGIVSTASNVRHAKGFGGKVGALVGGARSTVAGAGSAAVRAGFNARGAQNFRDTRDASRRGIEGAANARSRRETYRANHAVSTGDLGALGSIPVIGAAAAGIATTLNVGRGHVVDAAGGVGRFLGFNNIADLQAENAAMQEISSAEDAYKDSVEAALLKKVNKGKTDFVGVDIRAFTAAKQALDNARVTGTGIDAAEATYKEEMTRIREQLHTKVYASESNYNRLSVNDRVELAQLRVKANEHRNAIYRNSTLRAVQEAGINGSDFAMNRDVDYDLLHGPDMTIDGITGNRNSIMGDKIKLYTADNESRISALNQQNNDDNQGGGGRH